MSDQARGFAGWPVPADPRRQPADPRRQPIGPYQPGRAAAPDEDPPWFDDEFLAYEPEPDDLPWDRPADYAWPEPEPDLDAWYEAAADTAVSRQAAPVLPAQVADPERPTSPRPTSAPLPAANPSPTYPAPTARPAATQHPSRFAPAYPAPAPAPYAPLRFSRPTQPPPPYAPARAVTFYPPMPNPAAGNGHAVADHGHRPEHSADDTTAQAMPGPTTPPDAPAGDALSWAPVRDAIAWAPPARQESRLAPPPDFGQLELTATDDDVAPSRAAHEGDAFDALVDHGDPYDEFAPLADDLTPAPMPAASAALVDEDWQPAEIEDDAEVEFGEAQLWRADESAVEETWQPESTVQEDAVDEVASSLEPAPWPAAPPSLVSVFGDLFDSPSTPAVGAGEEFAAQAWPNDEMLDVERDVIEPETDGYDDEPAEPALGLAAPAVELAEPVVEMAEPESLPPAMFEPEMAESIDPGRDWPPVQTDYAAPLWSVSPPVTPWGTPRATARPVEPWARVPNAHFQRATVTPAAAPPVRPTLPLPYEAAATALHVPAAPARPEVSTPAATASPGARPSLQPARPAPAASAMPARPSQAGTVARRPATSGIGSVATQPEVPATALSTAPALVLPADPTRAAFAEHATPDELWFLAPQAQAHAAPSANDEEKEPTATATIFWTVLTAVVVIALVLAFLVFLTGVFR